MMKYLLILLTVLSTACSTTEKTGNAEPSGFLKNSSMLKPGDKDQAQLIYIKKDVNWGKYDSIKIEPLVLWATKGSDLAKLDKKQAQILLDFFHAQILKDLQRDYKVATKSGENVLRLRLAITEAEASAPLRDLMSNVLPYGLAISIGKKMLTGSHSAVGLASMEAEVLDSLSGERLVAVVDQRAGGKSLSGKFDRWDDVKKSFEHWSKRLSQGLAKARKGK
ncbi:MAG: DUF3313 domain-containing protein [Lentisphaeraceae bacterium]|nr:DUF3313 domain-containing protein [Lentisphaeraceae bacterium]